MAATVGGMTKSSPAAKSAGAAAAGAGTTVDAPTGSATSTATTAAASSSSTTTTAPNPRAAVGGWLLGPQVEPAKDEWRYRGERLGLPESGSGALAGQGRRVGALCVDWALSYLAIGAFGWHPTTTQGQWGVIALFAAQMLVLESLLGYTIGKRIFGIHVGRLGGPLTPLQVIARTLLLLLLIPAAIWDRDGRGMHDRLAGTVVLNR